MKQKIKYILYHLKWLLSPYINFKIPVHVDLELSTKCNLKCEFCFRQDYKYKRKNIDKLILSKVWSEITAWQQPLSVKLNWRGEAVLNPDFYYLVNSLWGYGIFTELNTSLSQNLSNDNLRIIAEKVNRLSISIDSMDEKIYDKIRNGADFNFTLYNFFKLYEYRKLNKMSKIIINRRTSKLTENESDDKFKKSFGIYNDVIFNIKSAQARNSKNIYLGRIIDPYKKITYDLLPIKKNKYCSQPSQRLVIDVNGRVWACCHAYKGQPELYLGDVKKQSLREIWNNTKRIDLVNSLKKGNYNKACIVCPLGGNNGL